MVRFDFDFDFDFAGSSQRLPLSADRIASIAACLSVCRALPEITDVERDLRIQSVGSHAH